MTSPTWHCTNCGWKGHDKDLITYDIGYDDYYDEMMTESFCPNCKADEDHLRSTSVPIFHIMKNMRAEGRITEEEFKEYALWVDDKISEKYDDVFKMIDDLRTPWIQIIRDAIDELKTIKSE